MILRCHAQGCKQQRSEDLPMCCRHWRMVPKALKRDVLRWREGSDQWIAAVADAVAAVAERERKAAA